MNHIFAFHGAEHKAGCTMIAQSAAEMIAGEIKNINVLFVALNGRKSTEYVYEDTVSIDMYKMELNSGIGIEKSRLKPYKKTENLYIIAGIEREEEARHYFPEQSGALLESLYGSFDIIIADTGSELDNGLALGALKKSNTIYMVLEQSESSIARLERTWQTYSGAGIAFDRHIVNKFENGDPYTVNYILARLNLGDEHLIKINLCPTGRQAEMERRTLLEFGGENYKKDILKIANQMLADLNMRQISLQRKRKWKSFI